MSGEPVEKIVEQETAAGAGADAAPVILGEDGKPLSKKASFEKVAKGTGKTEKEGRKSSSTRC